MAYRLLPLLLSIFLFACAPQTQLSVEMPEQGAKLDNDLKRRSDALHHFLVGQLDLKNNKIDSALQNLIKADQLNDTPSATLSGTLAELELRAGNIDKALDESKKAIDADPKNVNLLTLHAGILEVKGAVDEAITWYRRAIELAPDAPEPLLLYAALLTKQHRESDAILELQGFLKKYPHEVMVRYYLGHVYEQTGNLKNAAYHMKLARLEQKDNANLALEYVRVLVKQHQFAEAKAVCSEILVKDADNKLARKVMAQLLLGEHKLDEALEHFEVLGKSEEDATESQMNIALISLEKHDYDKAIQNLNLILAKKKDNYEARYALASAYAGKGNVEQGAVELMQIPPTDRNFERSRTYAAFLYRQAKKTDKAILALEEVTAQGKGDETLAVYLSQLYREKGDLHKAKKVIAPLISASTSDDKLLYHYGLICHELGERSEALQVMKQALDRNPKNAEALNFMAYDLAEEGNNLPEALDLANRAVSLMPEDGFVLDTLGWIQFKMNLLAESEVTLQKAASIVRDDPVVLEHYADVLLKSGKKEEAKKVYQRIDSAKATDEEGRLSAKRAKEKYRQL